MKRVGPNCDCAIWTGVKDGWRRWHAHLSESLGQHDARRAGQRDVQKQASFFLRLGARTSCGGVFTRLVLTVTEALASSSFGLTAFALAVLALAFALNLVLGIGQSDPAIVTVAVTPRVGSSSLARSGLQLCLLDPTGRRRILRRCPIIGRVGTPSRWVEQQRW